MALTPVPPLAPLYRRVIGVEFDQLPEMVRRLHTPGQACIWEGRADVVRGNSPLGGFLCVIMRMPRAGRDQPLTIAFSTEGEGERWDRRFAGRRMVSHQRAGGGVILERVGPITMVLAPTVAVDGLRCTLTGLRCFGLPLPAFVVPNATTFEFEEAGRYRFEIEASLAGLGLLVRYSGWLAPVSGESTCSSPPSPHRTSGR